MKFVLNAVVFLLSIVAGTYGYAQTLDCRGGVALDGNWEVTVTVDFDRGLAQYGRNAPSPILHQDEDYVFWVHFQGYNNSLVAVGLNRRNGHLSSSSVDEEDLIGSRTHEGSGNVYYRCRKSDRVL
jgi:hypothetical protein